MSGDTIVIREFEPEDDVAQLTAMLHRAYAPLAAQGLRYNATHQSPDVTRRRLARGHPFVAVVGGRLVGTITAYGPDPESSALTYRHVDTFHFGQFGVDPEFKGKGIGRSLHRAMIEYAAKQGAKFMALDTAAPAADLVALYERWGYAVVERACWDSVNYESVIMLRAIAGVLGRSAGRRRLAPSTPMPFNVRKAVPED
jgi:GNAT superfamily N-acetyltransferase